jgi:Uma2 family endonuclease
MEVGMTVVVKPVTARMLESMPQEDHRVELVRGEVISMPPAGYEHGEIAGYILVRLGGFVLQHRLGKVYAAETGFVLARDPDTVRAPDAAFVTAERSAAQKRRRGFFDGAPDLAVEVVSPDDADEAVQAKVLDYLQAGARMVWVIRPQTRTITTYRSLTQIRLLTEADTLDGEDLLPGFSLPVREIFET